MPILFTLGIYLFFRGTPPRYWPIALPLMLIPLFMATLADIRYQGQRLLVKRLWTSMDVAQDDVIVMAPSFLEGVGVLRLRRFVFPWGGVYFVSDWSKFGVEGPDFEGGPGNAVGRSTVRTVIEWLVVAISGFIAGRTLSSRAHVIDIQVSAHRTAALLISLALGVLFVITQRSRPSFANVALFLAISLAGIIF